MTEPTHEHFSQIDADLNDVLDAVYRLIVAGEWPAAHEALRLTFAGIWSDAQQVIVRRLMAGDLDLPPNPFYSAPAKPASEEDE
jgi:hypothetical protein